MYINNGIRKLTVFIVKKETDARVLLRLQLETFAAEHFQFNL